MVTPRRKNPTAGVSLCRRPASSLRKVFRGRAPSNPLCSADSFKMRSASRTTRTAALELSSSEKSDVQSLAISSAQSPMLRGWRASRCTSNSVSPRRDKRATNAASSSDGAPRGSSPLKTPVSSVGEANPKNSLQNPARQVCSGSAGNASSARCSASMPQRMPAAERSSASRARSSGLKRKSARIELASISRSRSRTENLEPRTSRTASTSS